MSGNNEAWNLANDFVNHTSGETGKLASRKLKRFLLKHAYRNDAFSKGFPLSPDTHRTASTILLHAQIPGVCVQDIRIYKDGRVSIYPVKRILPEFPAVIADAFTKQLDTRINNVMKMFPLPMTIDTNNTGVKRRRV